MQVSEARLAANRLNALKSSGPKTAEGKAISRRNGLKHGLSGEGIVVPDGDVEQIEARVEALTDEMKPQTAAGAILIIQMATLSVRIERAAEQESAYLSMKVRHAADDFDDERVDLANALFEGLADDPRSALRKLKRMPEGVEKLVEVWTDLRADLTIEADASWSDDQLEQAANLIGLKSRHAGSSRLGTLNRALKGDFAGLSDLDGVGLEANARRNWARAQLLETIDAEIAGLEAHHATLDFESIALDRAEAGIRAQFDSTKPATLARRYEAESRRGFFRALKEFRQIEADAASEIQPAPPTSSSSRMGSSRPMTSPPPRDPSRPFSDGLEADRFPVLGEKGRPLAYAGPVHPPG